MNAKMYVSKHLKKEPFVSLVLSVRNRKDAEEVYTFVKHKMEEAYYRGEKNLMDEMRS